MEWSGSCSLKSIFPFVVKRRENATPRLNRKNRHRAAIIANLASRRHRGPGTNERGRG